MKYDAEPHTLVFEGWDDEDQPNYHIEHLPDCPQEEFKDGMFENEPLMYYTCGVESIIGDIGLEDALLDENGDKIVTRDFKPGRYKIKMWAQYYPGEYGGELGSEWDAGLELVDETS